jgi:hypothetical protein
VTNLAAVVLVVLGAVIAILGFLLAAEMVMVVIGLLAVFAGGVLATLDRRRA